MRSCTNLSKILVIMMTMVSAPLPNYIENMVMVYCMLSSFWFSLNSISTLCTFLLNQTGYYLSETFYLASVTLYTSALPTTLWQLIYPFINFTVHPRLLHFKNLSLTSPCSDPTHSYLGQLSAFTPKFICGQLHKPQFPMLSLPLHSLFPTEHHHELTTQVFWN